MAGGTVTAPTTNIEAWRLVHDGIAAGMTRGEIAARYDLSYQMVGIWARRPTPPLPRPLDGERTRLKRQPNTPCVDCRTAIAYTTTRAGGKRCQPCEHAQLEHQRAAHIRYLRAIATKHGQVPTVNEAAGLLGMSRSRAGDFVLLAFGPDLENGEQRINRGRRPWPPRAASAPIG